MMRLFWFCVFFVVLGITALTVLVSASIPTTVNPSSDTIFRKSRNIQLSTTHNRKLKQEEAYNPNRRSKKDDGNMNLEDYHPIDPSPSSKATITTGPIEHGTPLIPFIPKAAPPKPGGPLPGGPVP